LTTGLYGSVEIICIFHEEKDEQTQAIDQPSAGDYLAYSVSGASFTFEPFHSIPSIGVKKCQA